MEDRAKRLFKVYEDAKEVVSNHSIEASPDQLKNVSASIYSPGPSFQLIFDFPSRSFDHVSKDVERILGYTGNTFSIEKMISIVHPDDIAIVIKNEALGGLFLHKFLEPDKRPYYKATYQYRLKDAQDCYRVFLHQALALTLDTGGNLSKTFVNCSDISSYGDTVNRSISFLDIRGIKSYTNVEVEEDLNSFIQYPESISAREIEILKLISEGFNSKQIAEALFISYDTVRTHRNNIITKNNFKSINQAVAHFIRRGLL